MQAGRCFSRNWETGARARLSVPTAVAGIVLIAILVFVRGLGNAFVAEDYNWLLISSLDGALLKRVFVEGARLRPLSLLLGWLGYRAWGANPWIWHAFSLSLHVICSLEVFFLARLLFRRNGPAFVAALVFAVYPRHHEPVLWLAANQFLLGAAFTLLTLILHILYLQTRRSVFYALTWPSAIIALAASESSIVVFPLMFLTEILLRRRKDERLRFSLLSPRIYVKYLPLLVLLVVFLILTFGGDRAFALRSQTVDPRIRSETYHFVGLNQGLVKSLVGYIVYVVLPQIPLRALDVNVYSIGLSLIVLLTLLAIMVRTGDFERYCVLWIIGVLLPYVLFVPFGNADRYLYLAAVGFALLVTSLSTRLKHWLARPREDVARTVGICVLVLYLASSAAMIQQRIGEWRRAGEIARDTIAQVVALRPEMARDSRLFFVGLPRRYGQANVLGTGIEGALRLAYHEIYLEIFRSPDPVLVAWLLAQEEVGRTPDHYVFLYDDGTVRDVSTRVADFEDFYESWWWYR